MRFSEILTEAKAWLQREGRLTYRALKVEFALDDDSLEDLRFELIEGQELAVDKDGNPLPHRRTQAVVTENGEATDDLTGISDSSFNRIWTLMHGPCVTIPAYDGPSGLPVGVQVIGRPGDDARVIAIAGWIARQL